ncbi:MAG: SMP-30/gluconolactonase/LRE family protein [Acidobacteriota bacterium]|nr:SMP-30/gluconolactonase/LRE family protein [Acidobacteriota bacterium]
MTTYATTVLREGLGFGESPRWHEGRLWHSDFYRHAVYSMDAAGHHERLEYDVPGQPSGLAWTPSGDLWCVSMTDQRVVRPASGETVVDLSAYSGFWTNEMINGAGGVAYVGSFGFDLDLMLRDQGVGALRESPPPTTNLVVVGADGTILQVVPDMTFPNGTVISADARTLIVGETLAYRLSAFDVAADGTLSNRRVWAQLEFVATDGMCLDAEGQIWLANARANECLRVREGGEITARATTSQHAFACMLGGEDRSTLYVMTAPTSDRFVVADVRAGRVEAVTVAVPGAGRP